MNYDAKRYYAFLGVEPACSDEEIRAAFRRRAKQLHPDAESGNEHDFIRLKKAYDVLAEPAKRAHYDRISRPRAARRRAPVPEWSGPAPRPRRFRLGGMSLMRFAAAFVFMAGLSLAALEVILTDGTGSPAAVFDLAGRPVTSSREAIARGLAEDPTQAADKSVVPHRLPSESMDAFAERMRAASPPSRTWGQSQVLGDSPAP